MKKIKLILITSILFLLFPISVKAATFNNGDKVEILSAMMPEDGTKITFTIPQGTYPRDSKIVIYGEKNVMCPVPGIPMEAKTPDKNPFTLMSEYIFSETDIKALATGDSTFITTMKFDVQCGDIYGKIIASSQTAKPSETQADRPSGGDSGATDSEGKPLIEMVPGSRLETTFNLSGKILSYVAPQGSYTLADWLVVFDKDKKAILNTIISQEMMEALASGGYEVRTLMEGIDSTDGLFVIVSDHEYEVGEVGNLPDSLGKNDGEIGSSSILIGVLVFLVVAGGGLGFTYLKSKKK